jgi:hypothetical protein
MPQISLYIDEITLTKVENAASRQHMSISKWVAEQIRTRLDPVYPIHYEDLFGSITDDSFISPKDLYAGFDTSREEF